MLAAIMISFIVHILKSQVLTINIATKHAIVVFQSPYDEAFPTNTE